MEDRRLPGELEKEIFELAAFLHLGCMQALLLVARRVKTYSAGFLPLHLRIEPLMYQVVSTLFNGRRAEFFRLPMRSFDKLMSVNPALVRNHTRHVCFVNMPRQEDVVLDFLSRCGATVNVAFMPGLETLPLQRLSVNPHQLLKGPVDFSHPLFSRITHLDILAWRSNGWEGWSGLAQISQRIHLPFPITVSNSTIHRALQHGLLVEVLVIV